MRFSERYGHVPVRTAIQVDSVSEELRNGLWSTMQFYIWQSVLLSRYTGRHFIDQNPEVNSLCIALWLNYWKKPLDTLQDNWQLVFELIRRYFFECEWFEVYDFVEFISGNYRFPSTKAFVNACNAILERECSAFRLVNGLIVKITDEEEVAEIEIALDKARGPIRTHLRRALELLSNRENPDYRNSIKESISAIESLVANALGTKGTLGSLIKKLEGEIGVHPALGKAFSSLYGYTSDEGGMRHAILESATVKFEDAKFFLVVCSAFANFVSSKIPGTK